MKLGVWFLSAVAFAAMARAQPAPPPAPVAPSTVPPAAAPGGAPPEAPVGQPGMRMVTGQAPIVGGNAAGARERALDDAIRQAVDQALAELVDPPTRAARAKEIKALLAKARSFVPRYRTLEEGDVGGTYTLNLEADVAEVALRRRIERWSAAAAPPAGAPAAAQRLLLVAGDRVDATAALLPALAGVLGTARAQAAATLADPTPGAAAQAAARAGMARAALLSAAAEDEGALRGTGKTAVACRATARVYAAPGAALVGERQVATRAFAEQATAARTDCFARLAGDLRGALDSLLAGGARPEGELGSLTIDAALIEAAAVPVLLRSVRAVGTVSSAEIQRMAGGHVELRVRTRVEPAALAAALSRDVDPMITLTDVRASGDVIHLQARLRTSATTGSNP
jgi:hypothetical protein